MAEALQGVPRLPRGMGVQQEAGTGDVTFRAGTSPPRTPRASRARCLTEAQVLLVAKRAQALEGLHLHDQDAADGVPRHLARR